MWTEINRKFAQIEASKVGASDTPFLDEVKDTIRYAIANKKHEDQQYSKDINRISSFDSRLNIPMLNAFSDESMYTNKTIDELEASLSKIKNEDIERFPDQAVDFIDIYDTKIEKLKGYRSLNNQYNHYVSKIPETEKFLLDITDELTGVTWDELTEDDAKKKREIKDRLFEGTQQIAEFSKFMENNQTYFSNNKSFNVNKENVDIGIIGGYNQLLSQINTLDPSGTIINDKEQTMLINSIRHKRPDEIIQRNETISRIADKRVLGYQNDFDQAYNKHIVNTSMMNSPDFKREAARVDAAFDKKNEDLKSKLANGKITDDEYTSKIIEYADTPENWQGIIAGGNVVNILQTRTGQAALEQSMLTADANFEKETGSKYSDWMGKRMPWRKEPTVISTKEQLDKSVKDIVDIELPDMKAEEEAEKFENFRSTLTPLGAGRTVIGEGATTKPPPIDYSGETVETEEPQDRDIGIMQVNEITFGKYNPSQMSQDEMIEFSAKIVNNELPDSTVGKWNNNDGWNNWTTYKNKNKDYKLALGKSDSWLLDKGLFQQQLDKIDEEFTVKKDKRIARAVMWAESKGDHTAININKPEEPKVKKVKGGVSLTEVRDGKTVVNYDVANTHNFKKQQVNLQNIASSKFKSLNKDNKKKYGNARDFMKAKYMEWLNKTGKHGKGTWYTEGDFKYFFPTKVSPKGTLTNIPGVDTYDLFDRRINMHPAFKKVKGLPAGTTSSSYEKFAKDFDDFRKFLKGM